MKKICGIFIFIIMTLHVSFSQGQNRYGISKVEQSGEIIIINYYHTPVGDDANAEYEVSIRLTREKDKNFSIPMTDARGDIGDGKYVGTNRRIIWAHKKQFPKGLPFDDLEFELTISKNVGIPGWVWYTGGAAIVGAGAIILLSKSKEEESAVGGPLPSPPTSRPN